jgi:hypothetical protein
MSKPNTKINVSGKSIDRNDLPQLLSDSDEDIAAFVDAFFDACVKHNLSESESMELLDTHFEQQSEPQKIEIDLTSFYASEDNEPHEYEALKMLSDEEVKSIADDVFGSIVPDSDDVTHKNNTNSKN